MALAIPNSNKNWKLLSIQTTPNTNNNQDLEGDGYRLANEEDLSIKSKQLRFFRRILRLCGFWHPVEASFTERIIYPLIINMLLLTVLGLEVYGIIIHFSYHKTATNDNCIVRSSTSIPRYIWAWLGHILILKYFKKRNLERKLLDLEIKDELKREAKLMVRGLTFILAVSFIQAVLTFSVCFVTGAHPSFLSWWFSDIYEKIIATSGYKINITFYKALTYLTGISNLYLVPLIFCITWLMYLLSKTSHIRLLQIRNEYMTWKMSTEDAVFRHYTFYTKNIKSNCKELKLLFISFNLLMIILTPQIFYLCVEIGKAKALIDLAIFVYFLASYLTVWIALLYFAESLKIQEERFCNEINNFCPQYFALHGEGDESDDCYALRTFRSRREVIKLVSYLKNRKSGFLLGFYSFHLQLTMVSIYIGLLMFVLKLMS